MGSQKNTILLRLTPETAHEQCLFAIKQARNARRPEFRRLNMRR